jgi:hypothetical protein
MEIEENVATDDATDTIETENEVHEKELVALTAETAVNESDEEAEFDENALTSPPKLENFLMLSWKILMQCRGRSICCLCYEH